jgi:hypothetical protein
MKKRQPTHHAYDFADRDKLVCLVCRDHFILVGYLQPLPADLLRIPAGLLRGRALEMVRGAKPSNTRGDARSPP